MIYEFHLSTDQQDMISLMPQIDEAIRKSGVIDGMIFVYTPHTTSAITINENADPDVVHDLLLGLDAAFPDRDAFRHMEGNSAAHLKSSTVGCSETVMLKDRRPVLGTWQDVYFCEFDGPRRRRFYVKIIAD